MALLPVADALAQILDGIPRPEDESVAIQDAFGRVLTAPLTARLTQPPFAASAMDGYAVATGECQRGTRLKVIGASQAGRGFGGSITLGEAVRIFTGAPMPEGAETVVIQENVRVISEGEIELQEDTQPGANVRQAGSDFRARDELLKVGTRLDAHGVTLAAAMGYGWVKVARQPVVAILATGDELVPPGTTPGPDQIVSSTPVGLAALLTEAGAIVRHLGIARDNHQHTSEKIAEASGADVLVTLGGASVGDHDLVAPVLESMGLDLKFWKVAMRPGKPVIFGRLGSLRVLGLPGNPVSALLAARCFVIPLVGALQGLAPRPPRRDRALLLTPLEANGPRLHFMRANLGRNPEGALTVRPIRSQDSSLISALTAADCLIVRPALAPATPANSWVDVEPL